MMRVEQSMFVRGDLLTQMKRAARTKAADVALAEELAAQVAFRLRDTRPEAAVRVHDLDARGVARLLKDQRL